jgi:hypothetical protein
MPKFHGRILSHANFDAATFEIRLEHEGALVNV